MIQAQANGTNRCIKLSHALGGDNSELQTSAFGNVHKVIQEQIPLRVKVLADNIQVIS